MTNQAKYYVTWVINLVCLGLALLGLNNMMGTRSTDGFMGVGLLFCGVIAGLPAALLRRYLKERIWQHKDQQQVAVETLSRMVSTDERSRKNQ